MSEKLKTFTLDNGGGYSKLTCDNVSGLFDHLRPELEQVDIAEGDYAEFTIRVERKHTQQELNAMPEWDGF